MGLNSQKIYNLLLVMAMFVVNATNTLAIEDSSANTKKFDKSYIKNIEISGTNVIKPEEILEKMQLRTGTEYDRDLLQTDLKRIYQMGYFSDKLKAIPVENKDNTITLKLVLEENMPITDFTIEGNTVISTEEILSYLLPLKGTPQNVLQLNEAIENIQNCYASKGYILARVSQFDDDPDGVINLKMTEGVINKINITGNNKTKDYIIARNILTEPGTVYNEDLLKADLVRLYATQAFKDVNRDIEPSENDPDKYDVTIEVKEQRTATISVGGGLDSSTGLFGSAGIVDNNFRGRNERIGLNFLAGTGVIMSDSSVLDKANLQAELTFFEPYFLNADNSLSAKLFYRDFGSYQVPLAIEKRFGGEVSVAHRVKSNHHLSTTFGVGMEHVDVSEGDWVGFQLKALSRGVPFYGMPYINNLRNEQLEGGNFFSLTPGLIYDSRDNTVNTRNGILASLKFTENVGLNGFDKTHGRLVGSIKKYIPVMKKSSLSFTAKAGSIIHGDDVPEVMAFRMGGPYTVRGFKLGTIGTGNGFVMGSAELTTPLLFLDRIKKVPFFDNLRLSFFVDAGKLFEANNLTNWLYDRPQQAITAGIGLKLYIPGMGPLSIDYGIPITNPGRENGRKGYVTFGVGDMLY